MANSGTEDMKNRVIGRVRGFQDFINRVGDGGVPRFGMTSNVCLLQAAALGLIQ